MDSLTSLGMHGRILLVLGMLAPVIAWRFAPEWVAGSAVGLALVVLTCRWRHWHPADTAPILGLTALVAASGLIPGIWDCGPCLRLEAYKRFLGVDLLWFASPVYVLATVAVLIDRPACRRWTQPDEAGTKGHSCMLQMALWGLVGVSLYFCLLLAVLRTACPHCLAVHSGVLALPILLWRGTCAWSLRVMAILLAGLLTHAVMHPPGGPDAEELVGILERGHAGEGDWKSGELTDLLSADRGRRQGDPAAPVRADLVLDFTCPHCRDRFPDLMKSLEGWIAQRRLSLVIRHSAGPGAATAQRLARLGYAAAITGKHRRFCAAAVGHREGAAVELPADLSLTALADLVDGSARRPVQRLLELDLIHLRRINAHQGETPVLLLFKPGESQPFRRWNGEMPTAELTAALAP